MVSAPASRNLSLDQNVQKHIFGQGFTLWVKNIQVGELLPEAARTRLKADCVKQRAAQHRTVGASAKSDAWRVIKKDSKKNGPLDGPCLQCKLEAWEDMSGYKFPFEPSPLKRFLTGQSKKKDPMYRSQRWYPAPDDRFGRWE